MLDFCNIRFLVLFVPLFFVHISCDDSTDPLPPVTWQGDGVAFGSSFEEEPCGATLPMLEERVRAVSALFDMPANDGITYYLLTSKAMGATPCGNAPACTDGHSTVYSYTPIHTHEIVHAVLSPLGRKHMMWEEGIAAAFDDRGIAPSWLCGEDGTASVTAKCDASKNYLLEQFQNPGKRISLDYSSIGHFTRYLLDKLGVETFMGIYVATPEGSGFQRLNNEFESVAGMTIEAALDDWVLNAPEDYGEYFVWSDIDTFLLGEDALDIEVDLSCGAEKNVSQYGANTLIYQAYLEVEADGNYSLEYTSESAVSGASFFILPANEWFDLQYANRLEPAELRFLSAGTYVFWVDEWSENLQEINTLATLTLRLE